MRKGPSRVRLVGALVLAMGAAPLLAAPADPVATRVNGFKQMGAAFKAINDQVRGGAPNVQVVRNAAGKLGGLAKAQYGWFPKGSGPRPGVKTGAKPEIWTQAAQFKAAQDNFYKQVGAFQKVVAGGDAAAIKAQSRQLGAACASCHRGFRNEGG